MKLRISLGLRKRIRRLRRVPPAVQRWQVRWRMIRSDMAVRRAAVQKWRLSHFPERQIFLRSEGRVRFFTLGSYLQMMIVASLVGGTAWAGVTTYTYLTRDARVAAKDRTISSISARYDTLARDFSTLQQTLADRARTLEKRQALLEDLVRAADDRQIVPDEGVTIPERMTVPQSGAAQAVDTDNASDMAEDTQGAPEAPLPGDGEGKQSASPRDAATGADAAAPTGLMDRLFGAGTTSFAAAAGDDTAQPPPAPDDPYARIATRLGQLDRRQEALAGALRKAVLSRLEAVDAALAPTTLSVNHLLTRWTGNVPGAGGRGGPLIAPGRGVPDFAALRGDDGARTALYRLFNDWERLEKALIALDSIPVGKPADRYYVSSDFGRRRDPVRRSWASHSGLDMAGWPGTAIRATAPGKVIHAAWYGPYGRMVEIDHGNGFHTRYGHMRRIRVKEGDRVKLGHRIGDMGKSGRATGTHLHYEVWFDGDVRDPQPFLKAANDVLEIKTKSGRHDQNTD
ncbi:M23 family metallopeptidase [Yunchengibacter salinarum]|uniref:M23 family metallopeptidase n=1 Tax=Yunchengibacter salinarum TaxID=3133399 RepID=UPI0035B5EA6A